MMSYTLVSLLVYCYILHCRHGHSHSHTHTSCEPVGVEPSLAALPVEQPVYGPTYPGVPPPPGLEPVTLPPSNQPPPPGTDSTVLPTKNSPSSDDEDSR